MGESKTSRSADHPALWPGDDTNQSDPIRSSLRQQWESAKDTIISPDSRFLQVARNPSGYLPYWLNTVVGLSIFAMTYALMFSALQGELVDAGLSQNVVQVSQIAGMVGGLVGAVTGPWLSGFILAGTVFLFISIAGLPVQFRSLLILVGYTRLPLLIGKITKILIGLIFGLADLKGSVVLNASVLFPDTGPYMGALLTLMEPFYLWSLVLLVLGVAYLTGVRVRSLYWLGGTILSLNWLIVLGGRLISGGN